MSNFSINDVLRMIDVRVNAVVQICQEYTFSIYSKKSLNETPFQVGSAFGVKVCGVNYFVTANHVVENSTKDQSIALVLHKSGVFESLQSVSDGGVFLVKNEKLDFVVFKAREGYLPSKFFDLNDFCVDHDNNSFPDLGVAIGYPSSRNKSRIRKDAKNAKMEALYYKDVLIDESDEIFSKLNIDCTKHLMQRYNSTRAFNSEFCKVNAIKIPGMSGAPIFGVYGINSANLLAPNGARLKTKILGLLTSVKGNSSYILYTKFSEILNEINNYQPKLVVV